MILIVGKAPKGVIIFVLFIGSLGLVFILSFSQLFPRCSQPSWMLFIVNPNPKTLAEESLHLWWVTTSSFEGLLVYCLTSPCSSAEGEKGGKGTRKKEMERDGVVFKLSGLFFSRRSRSLFLFSFSISLSLKKKSKINLLVLVDCVSRRSSERVREERKE